MTEPAELPIIVQKFGGTSVATTDRIERVADRVLRTQKAGYRVVVVVSAMGKSTDDLVTMAERITRKPGGREMDMLYTTGERVTMSLLAMAIAEEGGMARSFTGSQAGIITDDIHGKAKILRITPQRVLDCINDGEIAIVAGFQGVSEHSKDVTTLGRGGSDTTAVALAAALNADACEIYTDVDGVFSADPRIVPNARKLDRISAEEMLEMSAAGAGILQLRSVEFGRNHGVDIHVRSSFSQQPGTWVYAKEDDMEHAVIAGVAHDSSEAKATLRSIPDRPGVSAAIFSALADANVNVDMIVQNVSEDGKTDMTFTFPKTDRDTVERVLHPVAAELGSPGFEIVERIGKVSLVGAGMKTNPGVAAKMFQALRDADVNIQIISTSTIRVSVVIDEDEIDAAVRAVHDAFELNGDQTISVEGSRG